ncbi:MAG: 4Fe-4S binding protein [Methanoregula sp.]|nr:4Fe-4S binding protein [Methanoregula sp.]
MNTIGKFKAFGELITNVFRNPVTVRETFGFVAKNFRWMPRRDADKCTGCGACNERCSSGATNITDIGTERTISIDGLRCIFCGRCADVCPEHALELTIEPDTEEEKKFRSELLKTTGDVGDTCVRSLRGSDEDSEVSFKYTEQINVSYGSEEKNPAIDTTLKLQRCTVCGEVMPVTEKHLNVIMERVLKNLKPETAAIVKKDMELYLTTCISCRRMHSLEWNTHPRKFT